VTSNLQEQVQRALGDAHLLERELGGGGMSRVFLAHERALGRKVVVKVLLPELAADVNIERFRREIQLAAQLQHPHIVPLLSAGEAEGLPYFIMPFVSGESLRTRIAREGEFPVSDTLRILRDVVSALGYAHGSGVVHRDVKPENVLLSGGVAVVTDFGVAKAVTASSGSGATGLTSLGVALGTPTYMAPEQATASPLTDHRADIYALGVVAYEMLTGFPPFTGRSAQAMLAAHVVEEPEPIERRRPSVPPMLAALVRGCLAKRPAERPQSAAELMHTLDAITTPSGGTAATTAVRLSASEQKVSRRPGRLIAAGVATLLLLSAGLILYLSRSRQAAPAPVTARPAVIVTPAADSAATRPPATAPAAPVAAAAIPAVPEPTQPPVPRARRPEPKPRAALATPVAVETAAAALPEVLPQTAPSDPLPAPIATVPEAKAPVPPPAPAAPPERTASARPAILQTIADYAHAIESENLGELRGVYPGMTPVQQRGWEQFFQLVREVKAELKAQKLDIAGNAAEAQITGTYLYLNTSTGRQERQPVSFHASFRDQSGGWRIVQVR
jgi:tRNA A-37 threonylcarbamoyl transferase component Bud32